LGNAIGKPDLQWNTISDEEFLGIMKGIGMSPESAEGFTEMNAAERTDLL